MTIQDFIKENTPTQSGIHMLGHLWTIRNVTRRVRSFLATVLPSAVLGFVLRVEIGHVILRRYRLITDQILRRNVDIQNLRRHEGFEPTNKRRLTSHVVSTLVVEEEAIQLKPEKMPNNSLARKESSQTLLP